MKSENRERVIEESFLQTKVSDEISFYEAIDFMCSKHTHLNAEEAAYIHQCAGELPDLALRLGRDCFINCVRTSGIDTITVAAAYASQSLYKYTTIGAIVTGVDEPAVQRTLRYGRSTRDMRAMSYTTTEGHYLIQDCEPIQYQGKLIAVRIMERNMTPRDVTEWEGCQYHTPDCAHYPFLQNLTLLAECVNDGVIVLDQNHTVIYRNDRAQAIYRAYGYVHDIHGGAYEDFSFHGPVTVGPGLAHAERHGYLQCGANHYEIGEYCYWADRYFYIIILKDVTQEKEKEQNLIHKSVVLRESHHRVKNNLQTVYNLLDMQRRRMPDERTQMALIEAMNRIGNIASAYEMLSREGTEIINILDMLRMITAEFEKLVSSTNIRLRIDVKGDDTYVTADDATDIALVVNELLQNTVKHAFRARRFGRVDVVVLNRPLYAKIIISDDGTGFDCKLMKDAGEGLGHQIAENIVKQKLKGQIVYSSDTAGTTVFFTFRCLEKHTI